MQQVPRSRHEVHQAVGDRPQLRAGGADNGPPGLRAHYGPDYYAVRGVAAGDVLHIRAEPNPQARPVGQIPPQGTCIRNLGCRGGLTFAEYSTLSPAEQEQRTRAHPRWGQVEYQGVTGWVAGRYLAEGECRR